MKSRPSFSNFLVKLITIFSISFGLACKPPEEVVDGNPGDGGSTPPPVADGGTQPIVIEPTIEQDFLSQDLVAFLLLKDDSNVCPTQEIKLVKSDGSEEIFNTIQAAIDSSDSGSKITVGRGFYPELVKIKKKSQLEITSSCMTVVKGFELAGSSDILIKGFRVDASGTGESAIHLEGWRKSDKNERIRIEKNELYGAENHHGVLVSRYNSSVEIVRNFIHGAGRDGINFDRADDADSVVKENLITANHRNGIRIDKKRKLLVDGNFIIDNGRDLFNFERFGVFREKGWFKKHGNPEQVLLSNNVITFNNSVSIFKGDSTRDLGNHKGLLDSQDTNNVTTDGGSHPSIAKLEDTAKPNIKIGVENGLVVKSGQVKVPVLIQDRSKVISRITVNSLEVVTTEKMAFSADLVLNPGPNSIVIRSRDAGGFESFLAFVVTFDPDAPEVPIPVVRCNAGEVYTTTELGEEQTFSSIQEAIDVSNPGWTIFAGSGDFDEILYIEGKSNLKLKSLCQAQVRAFEVISSEDIEINGFFIDATGAKRPGIRLHADRTLFKGYKWGWRNKKYHKKDRDNQRVSIRNVEITGTKYPYSCVFIDRGNEQVHVYNTYLHSCGKSGVNMKSANGPHLIEKSSIADNYRNGVEIGSKTIVVLKDNIIRNNGLSTSRWAKHDKYGVKLHRGFGWTKKNRENITLIGNTLVENHGRIVKNRSSRDIGNYDLIFGDDLDGINYTSTGEEFEGNTEILNDTDQPMLTVATEGGFRTPNPVFIVPVSVMDMSPVTTEVLLNGQVVKSNGLFQFQTVLTLQEGDNLIEVRATDLAGNVASQTLENIILDTIPPVLSNFSPVANEKIFINTFSVFVSGEADEEISEVSVNGVPLTILADKKSFSGIILVPVSGIFTFNYVAKDLVKNTTEKTFDIDVLIDQVPPVVTLAGTQDTLTNNPAYSFTVSVEEDLETVTEVFQNGEKIQESTEKSFAVNTTLLEGTNNFEVVSVDQAGNISLSATLSNIELDTIPPNLTVTKPSSGEEIRIRDFEVSGQSNENLQSASVNGTNLTVSGSSFTGILTAPREGDVDLIVNGTDLAGNSASVTVPVFISLKLLNLPLVMVERANGFGRLLVRGVEGATRPGAFVTVKKGLFNSASVNSSSDGSFSLEIDQFDTATITVRDVDDGSTESGTIVFNAITKLSGIIRDTDKISLPGVTIRILGTDVSTTTNASGVFNFTKPPTGIQTLELDASTVNPDIVGNDRVFHKIKVTVNIGDRQDNVIDRPIYFPALMIDGTETFISRDAGGTVTSPHAPGARLEIPAGAAIFPSGNGVSGNINLAVVDSEVSTLPVLAAAVPDTVYCLEPSGMKFSEPVQLTLPNENELPEGVDFAIFSLNSETGRWEVDGVATVDTGGQTITTKEGQGITHFSEIYAVPISPVIRQMADVGAPGIDAFGGSLSKEINLPSFKSLGQDISPKLIYRSAWANPTATVNHLIDVPAREMTMRREESGKGLDICNVIGEQCFEDYDDYWRFVKFDFQSEFKSAYQPESISGKVFVGDVRSDVEISNGDTTIPFAAVPEIQEIKKIVGLPNQSVVSFALELKDDKTGKFLESGLYPTLGRYEIKLKHITINTFRLSARYQREVSGLFEKIVIDETNITEPPPVVETEVLENALPRDIGGELIVKNRVESEVGRGWDIGGYQRILNPESNSIVIDEGDGSTSMYRLNNTIETEWSNGNPSRYLVRSIDLTNPDEITVAIDDKNVSANKSFVAQTSGTTGFTSTKFLPEDTGSLTLANPKVCITVPGLRTEGRLYSVGPSKVNFPMTKRSYSYRISRGVSDVIKLGGKTFITDSKYHSFSSFDSSSNYSDIIASKDGAPTPSSYGHDLLSINPQALQNFCNATYGGPCVETSSQSQACWQQVGICDLNPGPNVNFINPRPLFRSFVNSVPPLPPSFGTVNGFPFFGTCSFSGMGSIQKSNIVIGSNNSGVSRERSIGPTVDFH